MITPQLTFYVTGLTPPVTGVSLQQSGGGERFLNWLYPTRGQGGQRLSLLQPGVVEAHPHGIPLVQLSIGAAVLGIIVGLVIYWKGLPGKEGWDLSKWSPFRRKAADQFGYDDLVVEAGVKGGGMLANALVTRTRR